MPRIALTPFLIALLCLMAPIAAAGEDEAPAEALVANVCDLDDAVDEMLKQEATIAADAPVPNSSVTDAQTTSRSTTLCTCNCFGGWMELQEVETEGSCSELVGLPCQTDFQCFPIYPPDCNVGTYIVCL